MDKGWGGGYALQDEKCVTLQAERCVMDNETIVRVHRRLRSIGAVALIRNVMVVSMSWPMLASLIVINVWETSEALEISFGASSTNLHFGREFGALCHSYRCKRA